MQPKENAISHVAEDNLTSALLGGHRGWHTCGHRGAWARAGSWPSCLANSCDTAQCHKHCNAVTLQCRNTVMPPDGIFLFIGPARKLPPARPILKKTRCSCILEGHLPTNPILSALHPQGPIQYICSLPLSKWAIDWGIIIKVKPPIKHEINLEVKKYYNTLISIEVVIFATRHWKGPCHSKMELKLVM